MTFDEIWTQLTQKQPRLLDPNATAKFSSAKLRRLLEQVYDKGTDAGIKAGVTTNNLRDNLRNDPWSIMRRFNKVQNEG